MGPEKGMRLRTQQRFSLPAFGQPPELLASERQLRKKRSLFLAPSLISISQLPPVARTSEGRPFCGLPETLPARAALRRHGRGGAGGDPAARAGTGQAAQAKGTLGRVSKAREGAERLQRQIFKSPTPRRVNRPGMEGGDPL